VTVLDGVVDEVDVNAEVKAVLSRVLEANERWERLVGQLREENVAAAAVRTFLETRPGGRCGR
jgi:hypothetical protein